MAAEQRVQAAEHRAKAEQFASEEAVLSQSEREQRIRQRSDRQQSRQRELRRRYRPGPGSSFHSPGMHGTLSPASRLAARAREALDREIDAIMNALREHGPIRREELERLVGGRRWGPGRFRNALRAALEEGRVKQTSPTTYGPPDGGSAGGDGAQVSSEPVPRPPAPSASSRPRARLYGARAK
jgi:hypothetical protein